MKKKASLSDPPTLAGLARRAAGVLSCLVYLAFAPDAAAFCGFYVASADAALYNDATVVALMRSGRRTVLSMQNNYRGPARDFALVVPVPQILQKENVKTLDAAVFERLSSLAAPRLVEYWEQDPCEADEGYGYSFEDGLGSIGAGRAAGGPMPAGAVTVEARFRVGEYEIVILSAEDSGGLDTWLRQHGYNVPANAEASLRPYVARGMKFFVAKVDVSKVRMVQGQAQLSPLRFHYDTDEFALPIRLGLLNSSGAQDLVVHILAANQRYDVANYENVTIPTNLEVNDSAKAAFGAFYASLFEHTLSRYPGAVITEYAWTAANCDPCPVPPLDEGELATLGADVIPNAMPETDYWGRYGWVLTRLHTRYSQDNLGEDLVFRAAPPIAGGRETSGGGEALERGAVVSDVNSFQARYAIRHPWRGKVECEDPIRGRWGGPQTEAPAELGARARELRNAPRDRPLSSFVAANGAPLALLVRGPSEAASPGHPGQVTVGPAPAASVAPLPPSRGCGSCQVGHGATPWSALWILALGLSAPLLRRPS